LAATFGYAVKQLDKRGIAFICAREYQSPDALGPQLRKAFSGIYIANEGYTGETAQAALDANTADAIAFGKAFIANPDLPLRLRTGAPLNDLIATTIYAPDERGYTDYPSLDEVKARVGADA
jgi:2,4-dienoyl-CoA reductase-like NADH-dependent reductase (Old Yellow Enzyme family)